MKTTHRVFLPFRLTVAQFACATQRCIETTRRDIRAGLVKAQGTPHLIHPRELERYDLDTEFVVARLKLHGLWPAELSAPTPTPPPVPSPGP
jgi:hypothetical protein